MPSQKPRVAVTLDPSINAALDAMAEVVGKPKATVIADLLLEMLPQIEGITKIARASRAGNKAAAKRALVHMVGDGMAELIAAQQKDMFPAPPPSKRKR